MTSPLLDQGLGLAATALTLAAFTQHSDARFRAYATAGSLVWAVHFALLGAQTAAVTSVLIAVRQLGSFWIARWPAFWRGLAGWVFTVAFTAIAWRTWQGWHSSLPWFAAVNGTYAFFGLRGLRLRRQMLLSDVAGLANGVAVGSLGGVLASIGCLALNGRTIVRMRRAERALGHPLGGRGG